MPFEGIIPPPFIAKSGVFRHTGGVSWQKGNYIYHKFSHDLADTWSLVKQFQCRVENAPLKCILLLVGGGGAGGAGYVSPSTSSNRILGGGGGAGDVLNTLSAPFELLPGEYEFTVGGGGMAMTSGWENQDDGDDGDDTSIVGIHHDIGAPGGGGGGSADASFNTPASGNPGRSGWGRYGCPGGSGNFNSTTAPGTTSGSRSAAASNGVEASGGAGAANAGSGVSNGKSGYGLNIGGYEIDIAGGGGGGSSLISGFPGQGWNGVNSAAKGGWGALPGFNPKQGATDATVNYSSLFAAVGPFGSGMGGGGGGWPYWQGKAGAPGLIVLCHHYRNQRFPTSWNHFTGDP